MKGPLVSTERLAANAKSVRIADASWYLPQAGRDAKGEYAAAHIPGAVFFDIEEFSDKAIALPHMQLAPVEFARRMEALGLGDKDFIVVYDGAGVYSAPRVWWMLRAMGHEGVAVLDGGLPKWRRENRPVDAAPVTLPPAHFTPRPVPALVRSFDQVLANVASRSEQVIDARGRPRFTASEPEPRPGLKGGHIPGSRNVPYTELTGSDGTVKSPDALRHIFAEAGVDLARPTVTSCGSGITASTLLLALELAGARSLSLYDGSWSEWGAREEAPGETG